MSEINLPTEPKARNEFMLDVLRKNEGCFIFIPKKIDLPADFRLLQATKFEEDERYIKGNLELITSYLSKPIIIDRFRTDNKKREGWRRLMEDKWGTLFTDIYNKGRLSRQTVSCAVGAIASLMESDLGLNLGITRKEWEEVNKMLKAEHANKEIKAYDPYSSLASAEKIKIVDRVNQLCWRALVKLVPSSFFESDQQEILQAFKDWSPSEYLIRDGTLKRVERGK